jgi:hypothetical protein
VNPEMQAAYLDIRQALHTNFVLLCLCGLLLAAILVLKVLIYTNTIKTLNACWSVLSVSKAQGQVAEQRRDDAAHSLERIEKRVADGPPSVPVPLPVVVLPAKPPEGDCP